MRYGVTDPLSVAIEFARWWRWAEATTIAGTVRDSLLLTGFLSALHLVGLTVVVGGVLVSSLRLLNVFLPDKPIPDITAAIHRGIGIGLLISVTTGIVLFLPRASAAAQNTFFQVKMALLVAAVGAHIAVRRAVRGEPALTSRKVRLRGAAALILWIGVAAAGCAYILLE
jgi:hypothetical protein